MLDRSPPKQLAKTDEGDAPDARRSFSDWLADEGLVMRQAFRRFVDQVLRNVSTAQILRWMEEKDLRGFLAYIGESVERLADELPQAFTRTARREIERLNQPGRFGVGKLKVDFDPGNSKAARVIERSRLNLIREITRSQRDAIREAIEESLKRGEGAEAAARRFRNMIGLTRNQARAVNTYQSVLERGSADALGRALRDRRFDRTINRIIENDDMLSSKQIERMVQRYAENMRKYRALTIARTEMMRTLNQAKQASWAQMAEQLGMDPDDVVRTWIATLDDRVRDTHEEMHLQTVTGLETPFESPSGEELLYPGDPMADGSETINCRCTLVVKFPRNKMRMAKTFDPNQPRDEHGRWTTVYHGTTKQFDRLKLPEDEDFMLDRRLGVHVAADENVSRTFVTDWRTGEPKPGGHILSMSLDDSKFLPVKQERYGSGALESDQSAIDKAIMGVAYRKDPDMLARYLHSARAVPEEDAPRLARDFVEGKSVATPVDKPSNLDQFINNFVGAKPYNAADRVRAVDIARAYWRDLGYEGLRYTNTSPMETGGTKGVEAPKNLTSYVVFDPSTLQRIAKVRW